MNQFIKPPFEKLEYGSCPHHTNIPVNLSNVNGIKKATYRFSDGLPTINFLGTESKYLEDGIVWVFPNESIRNKCFNAISDNTYININKES